MQFRLISGPAPSVVLPGDLVSPAVSLAGVDWSQEVALIVDMGEQRTAGYGVTVTGVRVTQSGEVELELEVRRPGPGSFVAQVLTHPYAVVRVPRQGLPAEAVTVVARDKAGQHIARQVVQW